jgi:hypothetical protein
MKQVSLTNKQIAILLLLYKFRFLNTHQIQQLLNHKKPNRIKVWLKQLTDNAYLHKNYTKETINKKPAIYCLTIKARELLKTKKECKIVILNKIYTEKSRSRTFITHCLRIADIYLSLREHDSKDALYYATKTDLISYDYLPTSLPDAYIALKKKKRTKRYFLEVLDEKLPRFAIRGKIMRFIDYYYSNQWEEETGLSFPSIIIICSSPEITTFVKRFVTKILEQEQIDLSFLIQESRALLSLG